ncbi:MCE family protein [Streptacidiphilus fuscans]|uniref:MCE family protein n=1 Tax=Streptacidiphilus fuscans TaxID=2789292 RepID=A0A931FEJ2_9ACTN|nr:MCE family protein [Streptacidiphilus fuscans]MBF9069275.1 MCE family protein [Streptacidiphilus fuscans]
MSPRRTASASPLLRRTAGLVFVLVPALLAWLAIAVYDKDFSHDDTVTVMTDSVGNEMHLGADVKLRGVVIGQVRQITADGQGARLTLAIDPTRMAQIPANVSAQMLPTTLFGERYVDLVAPADASATALADDTTIPQDRSASAVELEQVFSNLMPLLTAVQPQKLAATLNAVADALSGRGTELGSTLRQLDSYLHTLDPQLPALVDDVQQLVQVSATYNQAAPDLVQALTEFTRTSSTIAQEQSQLDTLYGTTTATSAQLTSWLQANRQNLISLAVDSTGTLGVLSRYAPEFPCTLRALADFVPVMDKALGKGTDQPGLHVQFTVVPARADYVAGKDTPVYNANSGPSCYGAPYTGHTVSATAQSAATLGPANSPQENELVGELLTPGLPATAQHTGLPDWSSLLAGPLLRGTEVTLR